MLWYIYIYEKNSDIFFKKKTTAISCNSVTCNSR